MSIYKLARANDLCRKIYNSSKLARANDICRKIIF